MSEYAANPVSVLEAFPVLRRTGVAMLRSLSGEEWLLPTVNPGWSVHDVALHLAGGLLANVSRRRDGHSGNFASFTPEGTRLDTYDGLVETLNAWNETWVLAARRISPRLTIDLIDSACRQLEKHFRTLDVSAMGDSIGWAGPAPAPVWLDVAREYTELWTHLAQIRDATGRELIDSAELFAPVLAAFVYGVPRALHRIERPESTTLKLTITGPGGGEWCVVRSSSNWVVTTAGDVPAATVQMEGEVAWRLATKGIRPSDAHRLINISGDQELGAGILNLVAILA